MNAEPWVALFAWLRMLRILAWSGSAAAMPMIGLNPANASSVRVIARRVLDDFDDEEGAQVLWSDSNGTVQSISREMARADRSDEIDEAVRRLFIFSARFYRQVFLWAIFFSRLAASKRTDYPDAFQAIVAAGKETLGARPKAPKVVESELDAWDVRYEREHPDETPETEVWSAVAARAYLSFLSAAQRDLATPATRDSFIAWAHEEARVRGWTEIGMGWTEIGMPELPPEQ
jgi:hypothetical protein